jgi:hypothetical protein
MPDVAALKGELMFEALRRKGCSHDFGSYRDASLLVSGHWHGPNPEARIEIPDRVMVESAPSAVFRRLILFHLRTCRSLRRMESADA